MEDPKPLAGAVIRLQHGRKTYRPRTDEAGVYAFYGLQRGNYQIDADLPFGMTRSWDSDNHGPPASLDLSAECQSQWIQVCLAGRFKAAFLGRLMSRSAMGRSS